MQAFRVAHEGSITGRKLKNTAVFTSHACKIWATQGARARRAKPNKPHTSCRQRQRDLWPAPEVDEENGKSFSVFFVQTRGPADQYSALYFATYQYFLGIALFILAIDPLWPRIVMNNHASFRNLFFLTIATHGPYWGLHTERHAPPFLTLVVVFAEIYR